MQIRVVRLGSRNPLVVGALALLVLALLLAIVVLGAAVAAAVGVVGAVGLLVRRVLRLRRVPPATPPLRLDPRDEVFSSGMVDPGRRLSSGDGGGRGGTRREGEGRGGR